MVLNINSNSLLGKSKKLKIQNIKKAIAPKETKKGVLFTFFKKDLESVSVAGTFNNWDMKKNVMKKNKNDVWFVVISLQKGKIEYKFVLNNKDWTHDPLNKNKIKDTYGGGFKSIFEIKKGASLGGININGNKVTFKYMAPDADSISLAGSFNEWNLNANPMIKDANGFWIIELELIPGYYQYKYVINGNDWKVDPMNPIKTEDGLGGENSAFEIK